MFSFAKASKPARFTHHSDKRDSRNCEDRNAYFWFFPIKVQTYVDKRRLYEAHPSQGQARLTRSWCNGVALCRTSSLQQPFKSSRWLVGRTRNAAAVAPSELSRGNKSVRPRPGAERISGARRSSQDKRQSAFFFFLFPFFLNCSFSCNRLSAKLGSTPQSSEHPDRLSVQLHTVKVTQVKWPSDAFAPWWGRSTEFLYRRRLLIRGSKCLQQTPPPHTHARTEAGTRNTLPEQFILTWIHTKKVLQV